MSKRDALARPGFARSAVEALSLAQKQRLEIVCALSQQPKVLILDARSWRCRIRRPLRRHNFLHTIGANHGG